MARTGRISSSDVVRLVERADQGCRLISHDEGHLEPPHVLTEIRYAGD